MDLRNNEGGSFKASEKFLKLISKYTNNGNVFNDGAGGLGGLSDGLGGSGGVNNRGDALNSNPGSNQLEPNNSIQEDQGPTLQGSFTNERVENTLSLDDPFKD